MDLSLPGRPRRHRHDIAGRARNPHRAPIHGAHARFFEQVAVQVRRDLDAGVPQLFRDVLDALALVDEERRVGVPQRVEPDRAEFGALHGRDEPALVPGVRVDRRARFGPKDEVALERGIALAIVREEIDDSRG